MRKIELYIDDNYASVLTLTAIGGKYDNIKVSTSAFNIQQDSTIIIEKDGSIKQTHNKAGE